MHYKDESFRRWLVSAADGGMYDIAAVSHDPEGLMLTLVPYGPGQSGRLHHKLRLVWETPLAYQISNETHRQDCWISDPGEAWSFFVSRSSPWLAACRAGSVLFPSDTLHFLIVGDMIADILATEYPAVTIEST